MKHLKKFNESVNIEDIKDILLELEDNNYNVQIYKSGLLRKRQPDIEWRISNNKRYSGIGADPFFCVRLSNRGVIIDPLLREVLDRVKEYGKWNIDIEVNNYVINILYFKNYV